MTEPQDTPSQEPQSTENAAEESEKLVLSAPDESATTREFLLWAGVLVLMVCTVFAPAMDGEFLWDDDRHVSANPALRSIAGLRAAWTAHWRRLLADDPKTVAVPTPQYYPLTHTSYWIEHQIQGFGRGAPTSTRLFHITNMLLHAGSAVLLWFILRRLSVPGAWVAAAVWGLHPMQTESVAWISERKNVLAGVFFFGSILAYLRAAGIARARSEIAPAGDPEPPTEPSYATPTTATASVSRGSLDPLFYALALVLFVCALLSKTIACSAPAVLLLLVWWKRGRLGVRDLLPLAPMFVIGLVMAVVTAKVEQDVVGAQGPEWDLSWPQRVLVAGRAAWFYAYKLVAPVRLSFIYPRWEVSAAQAWQWVFPAAAVAALGVLFVLRRRLGRGPLVGALIFVGVLVPALGFVDFYPMRYSFVADHFQYLASPALAAMLVAGAAHVLRRLRATDVTSPVPYVLAGVVLVTLSALTLVRANVFADSVSLWSDAAAKNPNSWMVQNSLGAALQARGLELPPDEAELVFDRAAESFARAVAIRPQYDRAWANWGRLLLVRSRPQEALEKLDRAVAINDRNLDALTDRGRALYALNRDADARAALEPALELVKAGPASRGQVALVHQSLGRVAARQGKADEALQHYARAAERGHDDPEVRYEYAKVLEQEGGLAEAAQEYAAAIRLRDNAVARIDLALLRLKVGNLAGARAELLVATKMAEAGRLTPEETERLMAASKAWNVAFEASTRPSTTQAATTQSAATKSLPTQPSSTTAPAQRSAAPAATDGPPVAR